MISNITNWLKWLVQLVTGLQHLRPAKVEAAIVTDKKRIAKGVKKFFDKNYELRFNVLKQTEEFRPRQPARRRRGLSRLLHPETPLTGEQAGVFAEKPGVFEKKAGVFSEKPGVFENPSPWESAVGGASAGSGARPADGWQQLTDRHLRRIAFEQMQQEGVAWSIDIELFVRSSLTPDYNPVRAWLDESRGAWDGQTDHIAALAQRVPTDNEAWPRLLRRWLLGMVAQWTGLSHTHGHALVPLLIGAQGTHKSTFCRQLLPPELREYYIDDIKLDNAEQVERMLSRMLLVNIDEYNAKSEREQAKIKRVLTEHDVQTRRMRSDQYVLLPRVASFIGTTNDPAPLTDPTGSRRYLCCELTGTIDTDTPIDYRQLYDQVLRALRQGEPYYLTAEEELLVERHNQAYRSISSPEVVVTTWFEPAARSRETFVRLADVQQELMRHLRPGDVPSLKQLALALKSAGFAQGRIQNQRGWYARRLE